MRHTLKRVLTNTINRDIKPENILLDARGHAHVSDFNVAIGFSQQKPLRYTTAGTLAYMSPEMLGKQGYNYSVDWWSLGVTAYELLFGKVHDDVLDFLCFSHTIMHFIATLQRQDQ